jgi:hypothetical protein
LKFNIAYLGPEHLFNLRRDFILLLQYALEDLGHDVSLSGRYIDQGRFNLLIGTYFLNSNQMRDLSSTSVKVAHVNTEVIACDMLNFNPKKVDFLGSYLPALKSCEFTWDVIMDNMIEHERYGVDAHFLRWGSHSKMRDINHRSDKDLDFYFFGLVSERRKKIIAKLFEDDLVGMVDNICPYFVRNDRISRSKIQLNLVQDDKYSHVNNFRICYLAENACFTMTEAENDPAGYLNYAKIVDAQKLSEEIRETIANGSWKRLGEKAQADFSTHSMKNIMEQLLDQSFDKSSNGVPA